MAYPFRRRSDRFTGLARPTFPGSDCWSVLLALLVSGETLANELFRLVYPTAAHRLVQIRVRLEELGLRRDVGELGVEQRLLGVGHLQINSRPFPVAQVGQVAEATQRVHILCL